jgi:hypothetical protein
MHDIYCISGWIHKIVCMCYICALYVPSYSEVKRVYDVYQCIFSGEESMCWTCMIYSLSTPPHSELSAEECHPA